MASTTIGSWIGMIYQYFYEQIRDYIIGDPDQIFIDLSSDSESEEPDLDGL